MKEFFDNVEGCNELTLQSLRKIIATVIENVSKVEEYTISITKEKVYSFRVDGWFFEVYAVYVEDEEGARVFYFNKKGNLIFRGFLPGSVLTTEEEQDL
jgi:hypothetical protein